MQSVQYFCIEVVTQPTGVAGININGNTKHSGLHMPCRGKLLPLNDTNEAEPRNKYSEVELVTIDEISMVSSTLFYQVHKRMIEIFYLRQDFPFGGKSVFFVWRSVSPTTSPCQTYIYFQ